MHDDFHIAAIDDKIFARICGKSHKNFCPVPLTDLRYLNVLHKNLGGEVLRGELICNVAIADALIDIFRRLFAAGYPIEKIRLIDDYDADDELSMRDNNSSCFNCRRISHTDELSAHAFGLAVDINPLFNPYIKIVAGKKIIEPATAADFENRAKIFPYKISADDLCCRLFKAHGFTWGGDCWDYKKDYQHFFLQRSSDLT